MIDEMHLRCLFLNDENTFLQIIEQLLLAPLWQHGLHELEANPGDNKLENDAEAYIYNACLKAQNEKLHDGSFVGVDVMIDDDLGVGEAHYNGGDVSLAIVPVDDQAQRQYNSDITAFYLSVVNWRRNSNNQLQHCIEMHVFAETWEFVGDNCEDDRAYKKNDLAPFEIRHKL